MTTHRGVEALRHTLVPYSGPNQKGKKSEGHTTPERLPRLSTVPRRSHDTLGDDEQYCTSNAGEFELVIYIRVQRLGTTRAATR